MVFAIFGIGMAIGWMTSRALSRRLFFICAILGTVPYASAGPYIQATNQQYLIGKPAGKVWLPSTSSLSYDGTKWSATLWYADNSDGLNPVGVGFEYVPGQQYATFNGVTGWISATNASPGYVTFGASEFMETMTSPSGGPYPWSTAGGIAWIQAVNMYEYPELPILTPTTGPSIDPSSVDEANPHWAATTQKWTDGFAPMFQWDGEGAEMQGPPSGFDMIETLTGEISPNIGTERPARWTDSISLDSDAQAFMAWLELTEFTPIEGTLPAAASLWNGLVSGADSIFSTLMTSIEWFRDPARFGPFVDLLKIVVTGLFVYESMLSMLSMLLWALQMDRDWITGLSLAARWFDTEDSAYDEDQILEDFHDMVEEQEEADTSQRLSLAQGMIREP